MHQDISNGMSFLEQTNHILAKLTGTWFQGGNQYRITKGIFATDLKGYFKILSLFVGIALG